MTMTFGERQVHPRLRLSPTKWLGLLFCGITLVLVSRCSPPGNVVLTDKFGKVQNGSAYEIANVHVDGCTGLVLPDSATVESSPDGMMHVHIEKTLSFYGHPPRQISISQARSFMGCATLDEGGVLTLATFGEWHSIEGGASMRIVIQVPDGLLWRQQPGLSGQRSIAQGKGGPPLTSWWYASTAPADGWKAVETTPDLARIPVRTASPGSR